MSPRSTYSHLFNWTRARAELNDIQARVVCLCGTWEQAQAMFGSELSAKLGIIEKALNKLRIDIAVGSFRL